MRMARRALFFVRQKSFAVGVILSVALLARAERLPIRTYSTADGLPHNVINKIFRDSRGFLWFCTGEGLARFDGYSFISYGTQQGLPHTGVNDILETRSGEYWVATNGGLVRFNPKGTPINHLVDTNEPSFEPRMFTTVVPDDKDAYARAITTLLESSDGTIWCGTFKGLQRLSRNGDSLTLQLIDIGIPTGYGEWRQVTDILEDSFHSLWIATHGGLYRRWSDGQTARYNRSDGLPDEVLHDLLLDREGQLWVASRNAGLFRLKFDGTRAAPVVAFTVVPRDFLQSEWINQVLETSDHKLWAGTARGLLEIFPAGNQDGRLYRIYTPENGLSDQNVNALVRRRYRSRPRHGAAAKSQRFPGFGDWRCNRVF